MDPAQSASETPRRRAWSLLAPLVLLIAVGAPVGVLAVQSPPTVPDVRATPSPDGSADPAATPGPLDGAAPSGAPDPPDPTAGPIPPAGPTPPVDPTPPSAPTPPADPRPTTSAAPTSRSAFSLEPGDCLPVEPPEAASVTVVVLACTELHEAEVFAVFELPGPPGVDFPGEPVATSQAAEGCELRFSDYVGLAYADSAFDYFFYKPDERTWSALGDRTVTCLLTSPPRGLSARGSAT